MLKFYLSLLCVCGALAATPPAYEAGVSLLTVGGEIISDAPAFASIAVVTPTPDLPYEITLLDLE